MILTEQQIKDYILSPARSEEIRNGLKLQNDHKVHVTGEGYVDTLKKVIGETRAMQFGGERELSKPVTMFLTRKLRDELSRWKNTQGTRKTYDFGESQELVHNFRDVLNTVWKNGTIDDFADFINDALYTDFNGFAIVERPVKDGSFEIRDGIRQTPIGVPYIIFKGLEDVHDFMVNGKRTEYLILKFAAGLFRVLDDSGDYIYKLKDGKVFLSDDYPVIKNELGYVAAIQISSILASPLNDNIKTSPIHQTIPLLQDYLTSHAEHTISKILHAHPILALIGQKCTYSKNGHACSNGKIFDENGDETVCPNCGGVGAVVPKNSSEVIILPELDAQGNSFSMSNIGQYITPPVEVLKYQAEELEELERTIIYSGTGIKTLVKTEFQTATEIVLNLKPLEDKISVLLDNIERVEEFMTDCIGKLYSNKYRGCQIYYGRKLNIRDENLILNEIEASKRSGMPLSQIRLLVQELIITRNRNSKQDLDRALILLDVEPCSVLSIKEVMESPYISNDIKIYKYNFDDYVDRFEREFSPISLFGSGQKWADRIKSIKQIIDRYNAESVKNLQAQQSGDPQGDVDRRLPLGEGGAGEPGT